MPKDKNQPKKFKVPEGGLPCKVQTIQIDGSRAKNPKRFTFGLLMSVASDTATVETTKGRVVQCNKVDVQLSKKAMAL